MAVVLTATFANAQKEIKYGVKAGIDLASITVKYTDPFTGTTNTATGSETGFFLGGFATIGMSEKLAIQPEILYVAITDSAFLNIPVLAKYTFAEKFSALVGPSFNYFLDAEEDQFKVNVDLGATYDVTENIDVNAKYSLGFGDVAVNGIFIGAGYKF